jgi:hypothetical protein
VHPAGEFRRRAAKCGHMPNFLRDRQSRDEWNGIPLLQGTGLCELV